MGKQRLRDRTHTTWVRTWQVSLLLTSLAVVLLTACLGRTARPADQAAPPASAHSTSAPPPSGEATPASQLTAAGLFSNRASPARQQAVLRYGGSPASEMAVEAALRWFAKHQGQDGGWDIATYGQNCADAPKCEAGVALHCSPFGANIAMTGYALLCFLGAGYDQQAPGPYTAVERRALDYLLSVQQVDGYLGDRNYENAIGATVLAEALAMSGDPALRSPAQRAVDQILEHQNVRGADQDVNKGAASAQDRPDDAFGWDYVGPSPRNDSSVSVWNVLALHSARVAGLNVHGGLRGARRWLEAAWKATNPGWNTPNTFMDESRFPYTYVLGTGAVEIAAAPGRDHPASTQHDLSCVGGACAVFLGDQGGSFMIRTLSTYIMRHQLPKAYPCNVYYLYNNTFMFFQLGGEPWLTWNAGVRDLLVHAQRTGPACFAGSWDSTPDSYIGAEYGRLLTTAYCTLTLEAYYRYTRSGS